MNPPPPKSNVAQTKEKVCGWHRQFISNIYLNIALGGRGANSFFSFSFPHELCFFLHFQLSHLVLHGTVAFFHSTTFLFMSAANNALALKWSIMELWLHHSVRIFFKCIWRAHMHMTSCYDVINALSKYVNSWKWAIFFMEIFALRENRTW